MVSLSKEESVKKISLRKEQVNKVCLKKNELSNLKARVSLVLDYSGSMNYLYNNGTVQNIIERIIPIAIQFDDNAELDLWIFENGFHRLESITMDNFYEYIQKEVLPKYDMGGTCYAPVMKDIYNKYIKEEPMNIANYVIFITDGDNFSNDKVKTDEMVNKLSHYPIFFQFVGIGNACFNYLQKLDDMEDRYVDNADFFSIGDINSLSDRELYDKLLNEFPSYLANPKVKDMISGAYIPQEQDLEKPTNELVNKATKKKGLFSRLFG